MPLLRSRLQVLDSLALPPLGDRLRVDPQLPAQFREPSVPPSNRRRAGLQLAIAVLLLGQRALASGLEPTAPRRLDGGAPETNLAHTASFHSNERIAPSNRGIKPLEVSI